MLRINIIILNIAVFVILSGGPFGQPTCQPFCGVFIVECYGVTVCSGLVYVVIMMGAKEDFK